MLDTIWWLLTAEAIGLAAFPLAFFLFPRLTDRGYSVSKPLGLLLIGYFSWILSVLHILPSVRFSILALLLVMGGLSGWYVWRHRQQFKEFVFAQRKAIIAAEAIFLVFLIAWAIYRAYDPAIDHTEQPMDFAFLNASIRSDVGSPEDPWLRGHPISYYYFGYWMMGNVSEMTGITSSISYNLSLALIPAMVAMGVFGLVYNLVSAEGSRWRYALVAGLAAALMVSVVANLEGVLEFMRANGMGSQGFWDWLRIKGMETPPGEVTQSWAPQEFWWWFRASRVINAFDGGQELDFTIQEFPFFSFMLGDLHPHVMSLPFVVLFLALCWNFLKIPVHPLKDFDPRSYVSIVAIAFVLGGLAFTNMWDLPTFWTLFLGLAAVKSYQAGGGRFRTIVRDVAPIGFVLLALVLILYIPYFLTFRGGISGILPVDITTRPVHTFIVWGVFLVAVTPFIVGVFLQTTVREDWRRLTLAGLGFAPYVTWALMHLLMNGGTISDLVVRFFLVLPFAALISMTVFSALWLAREEGEAGKLFALLLAALGLLLITGPELLFVKDSFGTRMNTVFKLYYQAWILLAIASGFAIYYWSSVRISLSGWKRSLTTLWAGAFIVLVAGSLYYAPAAAISKGNGFDGEANLDGLAFVAQRSPAEYEAIEFLKKDADKDSAMVEAVGEWFDNGLISRSTGIPTVFNWPGHEVQWRGSAAPFDGREQDVARIFQSLDVEEAKTLLAKYDVDYVYVGPREIEKYGTDGLGKFSSFMEAVFSQGDVVIYRAR